MALGTAAAAAVAAGASVALADEQKADEAAAPTSDTLEADVVIAGAGAAGLLAAVEACRAGKSVIVVDKASGIGMANGALAGGPFVVGSAQQLAAGIEFPPEEAFQHIMEWSHWSINAPVVRACVYMSGSTADMFTDDFGIGTFMRPDNYGAGYDSVRHGFGASDAQVRGEDRFRPIMEWCEERGAQFVFECAMESLVMEDGVCKGMNVVYSDGTKAQVLGKKTLVATGGFLGSDEMMMEHFGTKVNPLGQTLSDGTGINAVIEAGGVYGTQWGIAGNEFTGSSDKVTPVYDRKSAAFCCGIYGTLLLNHQGRRFANEGRFANFPLAIGGAISLVGGSYYAVVDQAYGIYGTLLLNHQGRRFANEGRFANFPLAIGGAISLVGGSYYAVVDQAYVDALEGSTAYAVDGSNAEQWPTGKMTLEGKNLENVQASFDTAVEEGWVDALEGSTAYAVDGSNAEQWPTGKMTLEGKNLENVQASFDTAVEEGWCYKADTLEELGEVLGLPSFAGSVEDYNALCEAGEDTQFGKPSCFLQPVVTGPFYALQFQPSAWVTIGGIRTNDRLQAIDGEDTQFGKPSCFLQPVVTGPFYALQFQPSAWVTIGGIRTNDRLQAIDPTGDVVEILFVAGADNGSTLSAPYCDYEGTSLMTAFNCGRLAGQWMAEDIDAE